MITVAEGNLLEADVEALVNTVVAQSAEKLPFFLTSLFVPSTATSTETVLMFLSRLGPLPYFGRESEGGVADDGLGSITSLVEAQLALEPHSQRGYRLALIDPPDAGADLSMLANLADDGKLVGAHLTVYRHPRPKVGVELRLDEAEEDRIARIFRAIAPHRLFTFEVRDLPRQELGLPPDELHHLPVTFDQSQGQMNPARPALHPIQPLAVPRRIAYREIHKTVELEPASGGPFEDYDNLVRRLAPAGTSYWAVHQQEKLREDLHGIASRIPWTAVADRPTSSEASSARRRAPTPTTWPASCVACRRSVVRGDRDVAAGDADRPGIRARLDHGLLAFGALHDVGLSIRPRGQPWLWTMRVGQPAAPSINSGWCPCVAGRTARGRKHCVRGPVLTVADFLTDVTG